MAFKPKTLTDRFRRKEAIQGAKDTLDQAGFLDDELAAELDKELDAEDNHIAEVLKFDPGQPIRLVSYGGKTLGYVRDQNGTDRYAEVTIYPSDQIQPDPSDNPVIPGPTPAGATPPGEATHPMMAESAPAWK